ncbi:MAG: hypothetical protein E6Q89_09685 [Bacteroidia bacterium]|nr:MAG: hypothetical protein E6Q89_09685 [Bacteroidia bacterium]
MKWLVLFLFLYNISYGQDVVTKKDGEELKTKIIEIGVSEIKYKKFDNLEGPIYSIPKKEVSVIKFENGVEEIFKSATKGDLNWQGEKDAEANYKKYKTAGTGTLVTSLVSPLLGLVPAIITSTTQPSVKNLQVPNEELLNNKDYAQSYAKKAKKIKQRRVWTNWGIGFGANLAAILLLMSMGEY